MPQQPLPTNETRVDPEITEIQVTERSHVSADQEVARLHFDSNPIAVGDAIETIVESVAAFSPSPDALGAIEIVVAEVINNIIEHAYRNLSGNPIEVVVRRIDAGWAFHFTDRGDPLPCGELPSGQPQELRVPRDSLPEGGFGWLLIRKLTQNLRYRHDGSRNHLEFSVPWSESHTAQGTAW